MNLKHVQCSKPPSGVYHQTTMFLITQTKATMTQRQGELGIGIGILIPWMSRCKWNRLLLQVPPGTVSAHMGIENRPFWDKKTPPFWMPFPISRFDYQRVMAEQLDNVGIGQPRGHMGPWSSKEPMPFLGLAGGNCQLAPPGHVLRVYVGLQAQSTSILFTYRWVRKLNNELRHHLLPKEGHPDKESWHNFHNLWNRFGDNACTGCTRAVSDPTGRKILMKWCCRQDIALRKGMWPPQAPKPSCVRGPWSWYIDGYTVNPMTLTNFDLRNAGFSCPNWPWPW